MSSIYHKDPLVAACQTVAAIYAYGHDYLDEPEFHADFDRLWSMQNPQYGNKVIAAERDNDVIGTLFHNLREIKAL